MPLLADAVRKFPGLFAQLGLTLDNFAGNGGNNNMLVVYLRGLQKVTPEAAGAKRETGWGFATFSKEETEIEWCAPNRARIHLDTLWGRRVRARAPRVALFLHLTPPLQA